MSQTVAVKIRVFKHASHKMHQRHIGHEIFVQKLIFQNPIILQQQQQQQQFFNYLHFLLTADNLFAQ